MLFRRHIHNIHLTFTTWGLSCDVLSLYNITDQLYKHQLMTGVYYFHLNGDLDLGFLLALVHGQAAKPRTYKRREQIEDGVEFCNTTSIDICSIFHSVSNSQVNPDP